MKNLTDFINEQLIMELSSDTYKNAANTAKARGEFDRALKFSRAALNSEIEELKKKYKQQEKKDKEEEKTFNFFRRNDQDSSNAWYKKYHKELIKLIHSDDVLEVSHGQILFKSGLLIGGEEKKYEKRQSFVPIEFSEKYGLGISIDYIDFSKRSDTKSNPSTIEKFVKVNAKRLTIIFNKDKESKDDLIQNAKKLNVPQEVIDQAIDICKRLGFIE